MSEALSLHDVLHVLRNPKWNTEERVHRAMQQAADMLEGLKKKGVCPECGGDYTALFDEVRNVLNEFTKESK